MTSDRAETEGQLPPPSGLLSDASADAPLLARLRAGEDAAFDELLRAVGPRLLAVARRMLRSEDDALDAVQEAFLSAFKALDRFDGRSELSTWLHRITINVCLMRLRTLRRHPERSIEGLLPQFIEDGHQTNPSKSWKLIAQGGIEQAEVRRLVRSSIDQLPEQYRMVLLLRDIEELTTDETAQVLEITSNAVKTRLHRARQALRALLDPHLRAGEL